MSTGRIILPGEGRSVSTPTFQATFLVTGPEAHHASIVENLIAPGLDVGAHLHNGTDECFYVLDGELELFAFEPTRRTADGWDEWESADGRRPVRAEAGTCAIIPRGCPHAFRNTTRAPARLLTIASPVGALESYLEAMAEILTTRPPSEHREAIARMRAAYDTHQITLFKTPPP
ncbi:cupin domain-containing protein [Actinomadura fibrosa]|uniref:Cupin domain-containing protein n=1 Tax=Actinomadura fibrosa TaxID=111802 RepID=A0ABW2XUV8_9ACTN|nr:cupin domain-containing protein [Actinomadura fibrosa]